MATASGTCVCGDDRDAAADAAVDIRSSEEEDPRYKKRSSGVNVLDDVSKSWSEVRDDANTDVDWILLGYVPGSRTDVTTLSKGNGGIESCSSSLPQNVAVFGGCRLRSNGRFVTFFHVDDGTSVMARGRASMHKNGVLNVLVGSDREIEMRRGMTEDDVLLASTSAVAAAPASAGRCGGGGAAQRPCTTTQPRHPREARPSHDFTSPGGSVSSESSSRRHHHTEGGGGGGSEGPAGPTTCGNCRVVDGGASAGEASEATPAAPSPAEIKIPYSDLIVDASRLPPGVDPTRRERHLSEDEFRQVFDGMDRRTFDALPAWRRMNLKKAKRLF